MIQKKKNWGYNLYIYLIQARFSSGSTYRVGMLLVPIYQMCKCIFRYLTRKVGTLYGSFLHNLEIGQKLKTNKILLRM